MRLDYNSHSAPVGLGQSIIMHIILMHLSGLGRAVASIDLNSSDFSKANFILFNDDHARIIIAAGLPLKWSGKGLPPF